MLYLSNTCIFERNPECEQNRKSDQKTSHVAFTILTSPGLPVKAASKKLENVGPGQIVVTLIFLS